MKKILFVSLLISLTSVTFTSTVRAQHRTVTTTTTTHHRHGWSRRAKGAAIGGGSGAVIGAVAGGGKGALIGGVLGAGAGYVIGNESDKNKSRARPRKVTRRRVVTQY